MAKSIEKRINDLRNQLETGEQFADTINQLFALADLDEFVDMGEIKENEILDAVVAKVVEQVVVGQVKIHMQLVCIEKYGLYHGSLIVGNRPGVLIYFESIRMGMVALPKNDQGEVSYLRFTADILTPGSFPGKAPSFQND